MQQISTLTVTPLAAFDDNYIWLLQNGRHVIVVDPGDAQPVIQQIEALSLTLVAILITHHHQDHTGGVQALLEYQPTTVYAPSYRDYPFPHVNVSEGDRIDFPELALTLSVMWLPGHTLDHVAYVNESLLFCGDVLFSAGCGRLFEGTAEQMLHSLNRLKQLPAETMVYCTHEYTLNNIGFALSVEPNNLTLQNYENKVRQLRANRQCSLPSSIAMELAINPFLRCCEPAIIQNLELASTDELTAFTTLRTLRNHY